MWARFPWFVDPAKGRITLASSSYSKTPEMELGDLPESHDGNQAVESECDRQRVVNGNPLSRRAFAVASQHGVLCSMRNYGGVDDRRFLSKRSFDSRLPGAQASGIALTIQRAVELGALADVEQLIKDDPTTIKSWRNANGETLLHTAVLHNHVGIVQHLLEAGADPTTELPRNGVSQSTLESVAPRSENYKYSRMLHAAEATPVHYACAVGDLDMLKLLLAAHHQYTQSPPFEIRRPGSLLVWSITAGHPAIVEYLLLKKKLEADCFDEDGNNSFAIAALALGEPLHAATLKQVFKMLARCDGIDINHKNMNGLTAFDTAEEPHVKQLVQQFGGRSARVLDMKKLLRWNQEQSREEIEYRRDRLGAIRLRPSACTTTDPSC